MPGLLSNDVSNGHIKGPVNGLSNGLTNGHVDKHAAEPTNVLASDHADVSIIRYANSPTNGHISGATNGFPDSCSTDTVGTNGEDKVMPIAVIGLALRFPGDATSPERFWQMLLEGRSARSEVPTDRFNIDSFYRPGLGRTDTVRSPHSSTSLKINKLCQMNVRGGHFMKEDIAAFDAPFFQMTPMEAASMDPMQRWLLEATYEALENCKNQYPSLLRASG